MIVQQLEHQVQHQEDITQVEEVEELKMHPDHLMQEEQEEVVMEEIEDVLLLKVEQLTLAEEVEQDLEELQVVELFLQVMVDLELLF
jgi:hypothetical protein